jgi:hypothetical protein
VFSFARALASQSADNIQHPRNKCAQELQEFPTVGFLQRGKCCVLSQRASPLVFPQDIPEENPPVTGKILGGVIFLTQIASPKTQIEENPPAGKSSMGLCNIFGTNPQKHRSKKTHHRRRRKILGGWILLTQIAYRFAVGLLFVSKPRCSGQVFDIWQQSISNTKHSRKTQSRFRYAKSSIRQFDELNSNSENSL